MHYWMNEYIIPLLLNNKSSQHLGTWNIYFTSFMVSGIRSLWWDWLHCWSQILKQSTEATGSSLKMAASLASQGLRALWSVCVCVYMCLSATLSLSQSLCTGISSFRKSQLVLLTSLQFRVIAFHDSWLPRRCTQNTSVPKSLGRICEAVCDVALDS